MVEVWGLKNCDTCRKALAWLKDEGFAHRFRDVRAEGLDPAALHPKLQWCWRKLRLWWERLAVRWSSDGWLSAASWRRLNAVSDQLQERCERREEGC